MAIKVWKPEFSNSNEVAPEQPSNLRVDESKTTQQEWKPNKTVQPSHTEIYRKSLDDKYGEPSDALWEADLYYHNSDNPDYYNRTMEFLNDQYAKRVNKPDFDPVKFGKLIENVVNQGFGVNWDFAKNYNKNNLSPRDRRYLAANIYDRVLDNYNYYKKYGK